MADWFFQEVDFLGGMAGSGYRNILEGVGLSRDEKIVRETLQNSVDATLPSVQRPKVSFRFVSLTDEAKAKWIAAVKLDIVLEAEPAALGFSKEFTRERFLDPSLPLKLLFIEDFGTTGLRGEEHSVEGFSDFYRFVYQYGNDAKAKSESMSLGSFGLGKSALASASEIYTFFVHSVTDPEATGGSFARTIGCGIYDHHRREKGAVSGRAWFGDVSNDRPYASKDDEAISLAGEIGFLPRTASDTGTSICIVNIGAEAKAYDEAVCKFWWPKLVRQELEVEIIHEDGTRSVPRPRLDLQLRKYIEALDVAMHIEQAKSEDSRLCEFRRVGNLPALGNLAAKTGVPLEPGEEPNELDNKVALLRQKGMVVEYHDVRTSSSQRWYAVFLADSEADGYLRLAEPVAHNRWDSEATRLKYNYPEIGSRVVKTIEKRISQNIKGWFNASQAAKQAAGQRVRRLDELFGKLFAAPGEARQHPEHPPAPVHIENLNGEFRANGDTARLHVAPILRLKDGFDSDHIKVRVKPVCYICEDIELRRGSEVEMNFVECAEAESLSSGGHLDLTLVKGEPRELKLISAEFDSRLVVEWRVEVVPL